MRELLVNKHDLRDARMVEAAPAEAPPGAARLRVDRFAMTANTVTYAAVGDGPLGYWDFFPAPQEGWGKPPCWGFVTVVESRAEGVAVGERFFGYCPIAESLDIVPVDVSPQGFSDAAAHRAGKSPAYNRYANVATDPLYDADYEPEQALFRPMYSTGWWTADYARRSGAASVVVSSASCKTALSLAHALRRSGGLEVVGLTSSQNADYVASCGLYDRTVVYDAASSLATSGPTLFIDHLGRGALTAAVHLALGERLMHSLAIGLTDWTARGSAEPIPLVGPQPEFFFAPGYWAARIAEEPELAAAWARDMRAFYASSRDYVTATKPTGAEAIRDAWRQLIDGTVPPQHGLTPAFG